MKNLSTLLQLGQDLAKNPWKAELMADVAPESVEAVHQLAQVPLFVWVPFGDWPPNPTCQVAWLADDARNKWGVTGNRCGKSVMAMVEDCFDCLLLDPLTRQPSHRYSKPIDMWIVSDTEETSIQIIQRGIAELMGDQGGMGWGLIDDSTKYDERSGFRDDALIWANGSRLGFKYSSQSRRAFQGVALDKVHLDEEPPQDIYQECYARTIDRAGRITGTFTPVYDKRKGLSWIYDELYLQREEKGVHFHNWSIFDNPHLSKSAVDELVSQWADDEKDVRAFGVFTPMGVRPAIPVKLIRKLREKVASPQLGYLQMDEDGEVHFKESEGGIIRVWERPIASNSYAIGADPALGYADSDDSVIEVGCCETGKQVCEVQGKLDGNDLGDQLLLVGTWYNNALIGVENNKDLTSVNYLFRTGYPNIYFEQAETGRAFRSSTDRLGWNTNLRTRPLLVSQGREMLQDGSAEVYSKWLLIQWEHFVLEDGKFQGLRGAHDDLVMAYLIMLEMMKIQLITISARKKGLHATVNGEIVDMGEWDIDRNENKNITDRLIKQAFDKQIDESEPQSSVGNLI